jgi:hypothetical protein
MHDTMLRHAPNRSHRRLLATAGLVLIIAACSSAGGAATPAASDGRPPVATLPPSASPSAETGVVPATLLDPVLADAAKRTGAAAAAIQVVQATATTWNDGSLGCPERGVMYTQALVDGYHVIIEANGQKLDYRIPLDGGFRVCKGPLGG